jgi:predicted small lipoprotein YifL
MRREQRPLVLFAALFALSSAACGVKPPPSQFPTADAALERMRDTYACARGVKGSAKIDRLSRQQGRIRGTVLLFAVAPELVRFDVVSPFGVTLSTLTSDGKNFSLSDLRERKFLQGPASACNIARLTQVPLPGHALVELMHGEAPVLLHKPEETSIRWDGAGYYVLEIKSTREASEVIHLAPQKADFGKPFAEQRVRILDVRVKQQGFELYHAEMRDHKMTEMSGPLIDEEGIDDPIQPSGPVCSVEVPRRLHVEVPSSGDDVLFRYDELKLNPPLLEDLFTQPIPGGVSVVDVGACE